MRFGETVYDVEQPQDWLYTFGALLTKLHGLHCGFPCDCRLQAREHLCMISPQQQPLATLCAHAFIACCAAGMSCGGLPFVALAGIWDLRPVVCCALLMPC